MNIERPTPRFDLIKPEPIGPIETYLSALFAYEANYDLIFAFPLERKKVVLGSEQQTPVCRFCCRSRPEVSFRKLAHVIPRSFGNSLLFSKYECDTCNAHFGSTFEDDFSKYFLPYRTLAGIKGYKGFPTMKDEAANWRIYRDGGGLQISRDFDGETVEHDLDNKTIKFTLKRQPYIPMEVYKCFLRIALTALPNEEAKSFKEHRRWLTVSNPKEKVSGPAMVTETFISGPPVFHSVGMMLWKRKSNERKIPFMFCTMSVANTMYQFIVPSLERDANWKNEKIIFPLLPLHPKLAEGRQVAVEKLDLSSEHLRDDDVARWQFTYEERFPVSANNSAL